MSSVNDILRKNNNKSDNKEINWDMIHGRFLMLTDEEFGSGSFGHLANKLGVPRSSFHRHATKRNESTGKTWMEERQDIQSQVAQKTISKLVDKRALEKNQLIRRDWKRLDMLDQKLQKFIESEDFEVNEENLKFLLEAYEKIKMNYAKMQEFINKSASGNQFKFNINVPLKYVTAEGRRWLSRAVDNPVQNIVDGDYEIIDNEEDMKSKHRQTKVLENKNGKANEEFDFDDEI